MIHQDATLLLSSGARVGCVCTDIGVGGAFVATTPETLAELGVGERATLFIDLPGIETQTAIGCTARWRTDAGAGLQFDLMGARETHALVTLLGRLSAA